MFLPDGQHLLFLGANFTGHPEKNAIYVGKLGSPERHRVVESSGNAEYVSPGYLVYVRGRSLIAQRFDPSNYKLSGEARVVADDVLTFPAVLRTVFSAVDEKTLVAQTGLGANISTMTWFDRSGKKIRAVGEPGWYNNLRLSPDATKIAVDSTDSDGQNVDIWIHDAQTGARRRFTFTPALDQTAIWSPDSKKIAFSTNEGLGWGDYVKNADGSGEQQAIAKFEGVLASTWDWSPDGQTILMRRLTSFWPCL